MPRRHDQDHAQVEPESVEPDEAEAEPSAGASRALRSGIEWIAVLVCALGIALLARAAVVEVFEIPSRSMTPTLQVDDRVAVYKLGYRYGDISRGDVVVFKKPGEAGGTDDLIKRVVALSGETLEIRDAEIYINGVRLPEPYLQEQASTVEPTSPIPGCVNTPSTALCRVPLGHVLMLGDNRRFSFDGRFFGPVDVDDVIGKAFIKVWPPNDLGGL